MQRNFYDTWEESSDTTETSVTVDFDGIIHKDDGDVVEEDQLEVLIMTNWIMKSKKEMMKSMEMMSMLSKMHEKEILMMTIGMTKTMMYIMAKMVVKKKVIPRDRQDFYRNSDTQTPARNVTHCCYRRTHSPPPAWFMAGSSMGVKVTTVDEPTFSEAMSSTPEGRESLLNSIDDEFQCIEDNGALKLDNNPDDTSLPTHVVLQVKRDSKGHVDWFRARIVAGGNHQIYGQCYMKTYAPVGNFSLIRLFLYMVICLRRCIAQSDIKTAFLNEILEEDVWVMSPHGTPDKLSRL